MLLSRRLGGPDPLARLEALAGEIDALLAEEIAERRATPREDILSMLVTARFEDGGAMEDAEVRDQLMTLLLAGHETTATGLAWTFDLLLRHPRALGRLVAEVDAGEETYLRAVVAESLRLRPVVPLAGRRLSAELRVNGHVLPPGTDVTPAIWLAHTRADRYPEPFAFRPERFLESAPGDVCVDPVRGRGATLSRCRLRRDGDARRAGGDPAPPGLAPRDRGSRAGRAPQRDVLAEQRHARRRRRPVARGVRALRACARSAARRSFCRASAGLA